MYFIALQTVWHANIQLRVSTLRARLDTPRKADSILMDDKIYRMFGSRVRALREERKVTQDELARRVDLSRTSITNIERGRQRVLLHQMMEIAQALDASPGDLVPTPATLESDAPMRDDVARVVEQLRGETAHKR